MILVAVIALTVFHPGYCFPQKRSLVTKAASLEAGSDSEVMRQQEKNSPSAM
jgi:hypothetical protein